MNQINVLKRLLLFGITNFVGEKPVNRFEAKKKTIPQSMTTAVSAPSANNFLTQAIEAAEKAVNLELLNTALQNFNGCSLKNTAHYTFGGIGFSQKPTVLCVIDSPKGADEKTGHLGSGEKGELLFKMLKAIQLDVETNTYLCPLIPWRLPGDRTPTETEIQVCLPFLKRRIELVSPSFLLIFGSLATQALLDVESIAKARQLPLVYRNKNQSIQSVATFGPDMVSKAQTYRKNAWEDLQKLSSYIHCNSEKEKTC